MRKTEIVERPKSRGELSAWYAEALDAQQASGLSVADYAAKLGVSVPTLYQWRRRLGSPARCREARARLVEVVTVARPASGDGDLIVRVNEGRRSIEVPRGFDDDGLRRLIESC